MTELVIIDIVIVHANVHIHVDEMKDHDALDVAQFKMKFNPFFTEYQLILIGSHKFLGSLRFP